MYRRMVSYRSRAFWGILALVVLALVAYEFQARGARVSTEPAAAASVSPQQMAKARMLVYLANHGAPAAEQRAKLEEYLESGGASQEAATRTFFPPGAATSEPDAPEKSYPLDLKPLRGTRMPIAGDPNLVADEIGERPDFERTTAALNELTRQGLYPHHVLGAPIEVQGPVLEEMPSYFDPKLRYLSDESRERFTPAERASGDWRLLAQIDTDETVMFGDAGSLYLVILEQERNPRGWSRGPAQRRAPQRGG
jgi:hypothetical protein